MDQALLGRIWCATSSYCRRPHGEVTGPARRLRCIDHIPGMITSSERRSCRVRGQHRGTHHMHSRGTDHEAVEATKALAQRWIVHLTAAGVPGGMCDLTTSSRAGSTMAVRSAFCGSSRECLALPRTATFDRRGNARHQIPQPMEECLLQILQWFDARRALEPEYLLHLGRSPDSNGNLALALQYH